MSSTQGFTFPPPPPPPPQQQQQQQQQNAPSYGQSYNGHRGGRGRGRGRGFGNRGGGRGGGNYTATQPAPSSSVGYAPMNYAGYTAQPTPGISAPQYGVAPNYPPSTTFPNQAFQQPAAAPYQQGYNGLYNQSAGQTPQAYSSSMPPYQNQSSSAQPMMGMPMPWGYGQTATGIHPGAPNGNGWNPQQFQNNGYGNQVANGGSPMKHANKRDHSSAFAKSHSAGPRVPAAPAVPSFGNPLPSKPPPPSETMRAPKKKKRQHNQLGLTPKAEEHESSEEEEGVDEESKFVSRGDGVGISAPLKFSYRGRTATLQTPEDIAKWIEERKKRFPTQARVEEKKKAMEEAKKAREEALKQKRESRKEETKRFQKDSRGTDQQKSSCDPVDAATKATQKAEKLRQKLLREQKRVAKAEADAKRAQLKVEALQKESQSNEAGGTEIDGLQVSQTAVAAEHVSSVEKTGENQMEAAEISSPSDVSGDSDWTSSSGSDDSSSGSESDPDDEDSPPEEMTSRREGPERVPPPPRENIKKRVCRHFARNGRCLRGDTCNFLHEMPDRKMKNKPAPQKGRQGLLQMLLDRQERDDSHRVMEAIMLLGEQGVLDEPNHPDKESQGPPAPMETPQLHEP